MDAKKKASVPGREFDAESEPLTIEQYLDRQTKEFAELDDEFLVAIRGHQFLDILMDAALNESFAVQDAMELDRIPFYAKIDLAVSLGIIQVDSRNLLRALNKTRNMFAHDPRAKLTEDQAREMYSVLSRRQRDAVGYSYEELQQPVNLLHHCIALEFVELRSLIRAKRDQRAIDEHEAQRVKDFVERADRKYGPLPPEFESKSRRDQETALEQGRRVRRERGEW